MEPLIMYDIRRLEQAHLRAEAASRRSILERISSRRSTTVAARGGRETGRPSSSPALSDPNTFTRAS